MSNWNKNRTSDVAKTLEVPCLTRNLFLDNAKNTYKIKKQLEMLGDIALKKGYAIGIGHVGPDGGIVTAQAIKSMYPVLEKRGIRFVYISQLKEIADRTKDIDRKKIYK